METAEYYRRQAALCRRAASLMTLFSSREAMLAMAEDYERSATAADLWQRRLRPAGPT